MVPKKTGLRSLPKKKVAERTHPKRAPHVQTSELKTKGKIEVKAKDNNILGGREKQEGEWMKDLEKSFIEVFIKQELFKHPPRNNLRAKMNQNNQSRMCIDNSRNSLIK